MDTVISTSSSAVVDKERPRGYCLRPPLTTAGMVMGMALLTGDLVSRLAETWSSTDPRLTNGSTCSKREQGQEEHQTSCPHVNEAQRPVFLTLMGV
jgi:hypothetical protein